MNKTTCVKREEAEWALLSGHSPRLVREGRVGLGQECITGRGTPGPARGRRANVAGGRSGSQNPLPQTVPAHHDPCREGEGGRRRLGPSSVHLKRPMCANQQEGGVRSRCPHLTAPPPEQAAEAGAGAAAILLYPSCMAWVGNGAGGSRPDWGCEPSPLPPPTQAVPLAGL